MRSLFIISLFLLLAGTGVRAESGIVFPEKGLLDLRYSGLETNQLYSLNGEWEFYWEKLLDPSSDQGLQGDDAIVVKIPSFWSSYDVDGEKPGGEGYGTYALTILLPQDFDKTLSFNIPVFDVACSFYINDSLIHRSGNVGTSREDEAPWYENSIFSFIPETDTLRVLIQVSNFHHRRGGFWQSVVIGEARDIYISAERNKIINYTTIGTLFMFSLFFLIFWIAARDDRSMLMFGLTTMGMYLRSAFSGLYLSNYYIHIPWDWIIRMEYTGTYLAFLFGVHFLHALFPRKYMNPVVRVNTIISILLIISVYVLPTSYFTYGMLIFQPLILLFVIYYLINSFTGLIKGEVIGTVFFFSLALFIVTLVNDILLANSVGPASPHYLTPVFFLVFVTSMAVMLMYKWTQNKKAMVQLEDSLRFKNKVLSVVAHDLKNPVASIAQFSDLMVHKPELAGKQHLVKSLQESAQAAVGLLDNLLYWGRSQDDQLSIHPEELDLSVIFRKVEALYVHMASQKQINLSIQVKEGTTVYTDEAMVNIILRNLVSNALKFTPSKGMVNIKARTTEPFVEVTVSDTGKGMQAEALEIFKNKGHLQSSRGTDMEIGTGLGLQLVVNMVKTCGGSLDVKSEENKGSVFTFTLPAHKNQSK